MRFTQQKSPLVSAMLTFLLTLCGCGTNHTTLSQSGSPSSPPGVVSTGGGSGSSAAVALSFPTASVAAGGSEQFTAQVTGVSNISVNWFVNGVESGDSTVGT